MDVTLSSLFQEYEMFKAVKGVTKAKARAAFRHLTKFCGDIPARELSPGRVNKFATWLGTKAVNVHTDKEGLSRHTVKTTLGAASQVFAWALRQRGVDGQCEYGLTMNPFAEAEPVSVDELKVRYYTEGEAAEILQAADELHWRDPTNRLAWYTAILLALQSGLRKNEITNLRWMDLDLESGKVLIQHRSDAPGEYWAWISKGRHEGEVAMGQVTWDALMRLREIRPWLYPFVPQDRYVDLLARSWPLPESVRDNPVNNWSREFNGIIRRVNRKREAAGRMKLDRADFHMLRKSLGTWLAEKGVPVHFVQNALRHASPDTTQRHYVGLNQRQCFETVRATVNTFKLQCAREDSDLWPSV